MPPASGGSSVTTGGTTATNLGGSATWGDTSATSAASTTGGSNASAGGTVSSVGGAPSGNFIHNDVFWKDTSGTPIYSQGGGVLKVGSTYYWYGVKYNGAVTYAANPNKENSDTSFAGVTIYSSPDLMTWKLENTVAFSNAGDWFGRSRDCNTHL